MTAEEENAALKEIYASIPEHEPTDNELQQMENDFGAISGIIDHLKDKTTSDNQTGVDFEQTGILV